KKDESKKDESKKDESRKDDAKKEEKKDPKFDSGRWADAVRFEVKPLVAGPHNDRRPVASPDGKTLLFMRDLADLARLDLATGEVTVMHPGWDDETEVVFSPDGSLIALAEHDQDFNKDIWILAADGSKPAVNVTRHPDNDGNPRFSADNRMLAFTSERTNEEFDVWVVMLDRDLEGYSARDLEQYFKDAAEAQKKRKPLERKAEPEKSEPAKSEPAKSETPTSDAAKPSETAAPSVADTATTATADSKPSKDPFEGLELEDAYLRVKRVTTMPGDEVNFEFLPTGERMVFVGADGKDRAIQSVKWDGSELKKVAPAAAIVSLNFAGDRVVALGPSGAQTVSLTGEAKTFDITATSEVDLAKRNTQKLEEIARIMGGKFYVDPKEKGLDWPALTAQYRELAARARTADEFDFIANMFIGHLDASHLGVRSPDGNGGGGGSASNRRAQGRLGVATARSEGGRVVTDVLPDSPAALANPKLEVGDTITAIDFEAVDPAKPLESMLAGKTGQEVFVSFTRKAANATPDAKPAELGCMIVPMGSMEERALRYRAEVLANARKVDELSGGRIGYLHIQSMDQASLDRFERDLYAAATGREGLLVDVRNNGGGFTADRLLSSIDVRPHAYAIPREGDRSRTTSYPQDRLFIQRYTLPMAMLCNEKSFSNAEITSHAFKTLGRGPLVGQQTAGGVISTGSESLVDGTTVRMPFRGWYLFDGTDMEEHGAMPDFVVPQTPEDESRGYDAQLAKAVEELLKSLPKKPASGAGG
ncbi:MAG: S41 family peptidase, partial [Limnohabitans sp.]|nr:S41 family peptidase [Limnohabitans sp.]